MLNELLKQRPPALLVLAVFLFLGTIIYRETSEKEVFPVFLSEKQNNIYIELIINGSSEGVYQINDGSVVCDVINLTGRNSFDLRLKDVDCVKPLINGQRLFIRRKGHEYEIIEKDWIPAGQRIALSIPLHPDRMTPSDWIVLPGIGEKLAARIEFDRQKNGDFGGVEELLRVKGIGKKRIQAWRQFFVGM